MFSLFTHQVATVWYKINYRVCNGGNPNTTVNENVFCAPSNLYIELYKTVKY